MCGNCMVLNYCTCSNSFMHICGIVNKLWNCIDLKRNCTKFLFFREIEEIVTSIFLQNYSIKNKLVIFYAQICVCALGLLF